MTSRPTRGAALLAAALATLASCAGDPRRVVEPSIRRPAPSTPAAGVVARTSEAKERSLAVSLVFDDRGLHVRISATGSAAELRAWTLGEDEPDRLEVRGQSAAGRGLTFRRTNRRVAVDVEGDVTELAYDVRGQPFDEDARSTLVEAARFRAVGEKILALPEAFLAKPVDATVIVDGRGVDTPVVASSFGVGRGHVTHTIRVLGSELARAIFFGGGGGRVEMDAPEGHDEAAWIGYTAFDPRAVAAEVAGFRGLLHEYFAGTELEPATFLLSVDGRPRAHFRVLRRARGVFVALAGTDPFDSTLRLAVAHELVHAWVGERIWLGDATPGREAETFWFHEGVTRWIAREQLARAGLLTPDEYAAEVDRMLGVVTTSRHSSRPMKDLALDRASSGVVPLLVARGVLFATLEDARVRESSRGARSLDDVIGKLARLAAEKRGPLPDDALRVALANEIGDARAREDFEDVVATGKKVRLPEAALGSCFEPYELAYDVYEPGLDVAATRHSKRVTGLDPKSAAAASGLREHDAVVAFDVPDRADAVARVEVERDGARVVATYKPTSGKRRGQAFRKRPSLTDEACRKVMLRR